MNAILLYRGSINDEVVDFIIDPLGKDITEHCKFVVNNDDIIEVLVDGVKYSSSTNWGENYPPGKTGVVLWRVSHQANNPV